MRDWRVIGVVLWGVGMMTDDELDDSRDEREEDAIAKWDRRHSWLDYDESAEDDDWSEDYPYERHLAQVADAVDRILGEGRR